MKSSSNRHSTTNSISILLQSFLQKLGQGERLLVYMALIAMALLVVIDIAFRELANSGLPWASKTAVYLMIWLGFIGSSLASQKGIHLRPEFCDKLWKRRKGLFERIRHGTTGIFCLCAICPTVKYVADSFELGDSNPILGIPLWIVQVVIPYTFLSMGIKHTLFALKPELAPVKEGNTRH